MSIRAWWFAILVACGSQPPPPPAPVANTAPPAAGAPTKPSRSDALGSFTTRTRAQAATTGTGSVAGMITSTTGEPLIGATIVFESSQLIGERVQISDEKGAFTIDGFPAGRYRVTVYFNDQMVRRAFDVETDRVTDLTLAGWDEAFVERRDPTPEPVLPEPY